MSPRRFDARRGGAARDHAKPRRYRRALLSFIAGASEVQGRERVRCEVERDGDRRRREGKGREGGWRRFLLFRGEEPPGNGKRNDPFERSPKKREILAFSFLINKVTIRNIVNNRIFDK
ncbi:hypothetical protein EUGRSUZ_B03710 [Eucalyptus grandis]|uniref:Uncharacterized protein n=2 Tax=Eucalyptus grandis TaxID=71139 RepID=A0ACC3LYL7_EUCGR|nr:hypothetical protein EUGRSUZ_B03710 [Eucalyptus grandis]